MTLIVEIEQEGDGRWIAEVPALSGVLRYGATRDEALAYGQALALRALAERLEHGEAPAGLLTCGRSPGRGSVSPADRR